MAIYSGKGYRWGRMVLTSESPFQVNNFSWGSGDTTLDRINDQHGAGTGTGTGSTVGGGGGGGSAMMNPLFTHQGAMHVDATRDAASPTYNQNMLALNTTAWELPYSGPHCIPSLPLYQDDDQTSILRCVLVPAPEQ